MAHFAELEEKTDPTGFTNDTHLIVKRVIVVDNAHVESDEHASGENWCSTFFGGGTWKQTSYNHNFRKMYAGIGMIYDAAKNKFLVPQPFASWSLDANDDWQAPVTFPAGDQSAYIVSWDEAGQKWTGVKKSDESNWNWDASGLTWVSA
tara:strand:+ start:2124 stop:2570 length:447 start_codon:yes stop_codon:yes gene_type:complete